MLSAQLARDLGVKVRHIDTSFPNFIADLLADRCDVAMFGVAVLPERAAKVRFTQPYLRSDIWAVTTKTHPSIRQWSDIDKAGHVVGVQAGTFMEPVMKKSLHRCLHDRLPLQPAGAGQRRLGPGGGAR